MPGGIDPTPARKRLDQFPRPVRKKLKPAPLIDETEARLLLPEKQFREALFKDFVRFCHSHGGVVVSVPWTSPAVVLVPLGDGETSALEIALQQLPKYKVVKLPATVTRLSHGVFSEMHQIEVVLWASA